MGMEIMFVPVSNGPALAAGDSDTTGKPTSVSGAMPEADCATASEGESVHTVPSGPVQYTYAFDMVILALR